MASINVPFKIEDKFLENPVTSEFSYDPNKKGKEHCLARAQEIYCNHIQSRSGIPISRQANFDYLRKYGLGDQDENTYVKFFFKETGGDPGPSAIRADGADMYDGMSKESAAKGFMNVFWSVLSLAPKIVSAIVGQFEKGEYDVVADPIDPLSKTLKEEKKALLWYKSMNRDFEKAFQEGAGMQYKEPDFLPENKQELDLYDEMGGFKEDYAAAMEMLIKHTFDVSDWGEIRKQIVEDAINLNVFSTKDYFCERDQRIKTKYIDVDRLVIQASSDPAFKDAEYAGHFSDVSVGELRERGFTEEELKSAAKYYSGYAGNPQIDKWGMYDVPNMYGTGASYDFYKVCVFECEWVEIDRMQDVIWTNEYGRNTVLRQNYGDDPPSSEKAKTRYTDVRMKYRCSWIVGTDMAYEWGKCYDITRKSLREINLSYHVYQLKGKSITERLIPIYDNFQILWVKFQNAISMARNAGYAIDYDAISSITLGGKAFSEELVIKRFLETGNLIFKRTTVGGKPKTGSQIPVYELKSNIADSFIQFREGFNMNISMVEALTGFTPLIIGGAPDPNAPVSSSNAAMNATINTLRPMVSAYMHTKKEIAENITLWIQILIRGNRQIALKYAEVVGVDKIKVLMQAEGNGVYYGINLIPRPTDSEKNQIFETAKISLANGRDGKPGISEADFFAILHILASGGSLRLAEMTLENAIRRDQRRRDQIAQQNMQIQQEGAARIQQEKSQGELTKIQIEKDLELRNKQEEHRMKMEELTLQASLKEQTEGIK